MSDTKAVNYEKEIPDVLQALADVHDVMTPTASTACSTTWSCCAPRRSTAAATASRCTRGKPARTARPANGWTG